MRQKAGRTADVRADGKTDRKVDGTTNRTADKKLASNTDKQLASNTDKQLASNTDKKPGTGNDGFYYEAAAIVEKVRTGKGRIKSLCFNSRHRNKKGLFAVVTETCKNFDLLEQALENAKFFENEKRVRRYLAVVLAHDLVNDRASECSPTLAEPMMRNKTRIRAEYTKLRIKRPPKAEVKLMRYARVNTLKMTTEECMEQLQKDGLPPFTRDVHIEDLLVFPPGTDLTRTSLYQSGALVLQDKASCMPVALLSPPTGATVIDACAAPGNKTTQLAAAVGRTGKIIAFERDPARHAILTKTLGKHGCGHAEAHCRDFLLTNPKNYTQVEYALVDPSCSGSGMLESYENTEACDAARLQSLSNFQCKILRHAMKFPNVKRVVYSTCSIHKEENEEVVKQVLEHEPDFQLCQGLFPTWPRRGLPDYDFSDSVIRAEISDGMNGFFVACFARKRQ